MKKFITDQEKFWANSFGKKYILRNQNKQLLSSNINFFSKALACVDKLNSCIEFGSNIGMNIKALELLIPKIDITAVEINKHACAKLKKILKNQKIYNQSILNFNSKKKWDLVLVKGFLIHINPNYLKAVYKKMYNACNKYILIAEYYNPTPVTVEYRGYKDKLFKRDFANDFLIKYPKMSLVDYGFIYRHDTKYKLDDINWFLLKKNK